MIIVTNVQVTAAIEAVVEEAGQDYVYPSYDGQEEQCFYVWDDKPSCLIGRVLHRLGADIRDLKRCDSIGNIGNSVLQTVGIVMRGVAVDALRSAQSTQDRYFSWGTALDHYLRVMDHERIPW